MISWEVMLSKGQQWDWFGDPFWRVQTLFVAFVAGADRLSDFGRCASRNPVVNFRPLVERNFAVSASSFFARIAVLYGASTSLPGLLQSLFGYDATGSGLVLSPSGLFSVMMLLFVGSCSAAGSMPVG